MKNLRLRVAPFLFPLLWAYGAQAQQANFTYTATPAGSCAPVTVSFQSTTTGTPVSLTWDFGDGRSSHTANPQVIYGTGNTYRVTLTAQYANTSSTYWKDITINALPVVDFSADITNSCRFYTATFTDLTADGALRTWDFGDGSAPVSANNAAVQHNYAKAGVFDVTLTVANAYGCTQTLQKKAYIHVALPVVELSGTVTQGCAPLLATLTANVTGTGADPVTGYAWAFGDGAAQSTTTPGVTHTYSGTGSFNPGVVITTQGGCTATATVNGLVKTGTPPSGVSFTASPDNTCVGNPVRLLANAANANSYSWDFGDGITQEGPENDIRHTFRQNGTLNVQMKAGNNGCYTAAVPVSVTITGPVASFTSARTCGNTGEFTFTNTSTGVTPGTTWEWDFNDGSPLVTTQHATHTYTLPGKYTVRLTIKDNSSACNSSAFDTLYYFRPLFSTGVNNICRGMEVTYSVLNVPAPLVAEYRWHFADGTTVSSTLPDVKKVWDNKGTFTDQLEIFYNNPTYCMDVVTATSPITIMAPTANFDLAGAACASQPVLYSNTSQSWPNIPLTNWKWDLGNGTTAAVQTPAATLYSASGPYSVKLVVTDARNCMDSITKTVNINAAPYVYALPKTPRICEGNSVTLNTLTDAAAAQWSPNSALSCINCFTTDATPLQDTKYYVTAANANGCTAIDSVSVKVIPKVNLTVRPDTTICQGGSVMLEAAGASFYSWSPADYLTGTGFSNPITTPDGSIEYTVTGSNDVACPTQTAKVKIDVKAKPTVSAGPDQLLAVGSIARLGATASADVIKWDWSPADYLDCTACPTTTAAVRKPMAYSVTVTNADGCTASDLVEIKLACVQDVVFVPNTFSPNGDGMNDIFYVRGKGVNMIFSFRIFNRMGQEVFHRERINIDDISAGWDGTYKGRPQPQDVYVYLLDVICDTFDRFQLKGNVMLLR